MGLPDSWWWRTPTTLAYSQIEEDLMRVLLSREKIKVNGHDCYVVGVEPGYNSNHPGEKLKFTIVRA